MGRHIGEPMLTTSVRISPEFHKACIDGKISFSEALRVGISLILAERGILEYDNSLNIMRRIVLLTKRLEDTTEELERLKDLAEKRKV